MYNTKGNKSKNSSSSILNKRKRSEEYSWLKRNMMSELESDDSLEDLLKATESDEKLKELTRCVGGIFVKKRHIDYEQIHANLIKNNLIPLCDNYISKHGNMYINKNFVLEECIAICNKLTDKHKVIHVEKCIEFIRYLIAFQNEGTKFRNIKRMFYMRNYPIIVVGNLPDKLRETNHAWKERKKYFRYKMGYNVQRMSALFYCINDFNNKLKKKYKEFEQKSIINVLTQTFIEKEISDCDFERIDEYWKDISMKEFEELGGLENINIQEWKLIEEAFN